MKDILRMDVQFHASPEQLYADWLNSETHSEFTGGEAHIQEALNSNYTTWDGYISGLILELEKGKRIFQTWRTTEFNKEDEDSFLEIILEPVGDKTKLILIHTNIPEGEGEKYEEGWNSYYFDPMRTYYTQH